MRMLATIAVLLIANSLTLWIVGDFNLYLWHGNEKEFKGFASPIERLIASCVVGALSAIPTAIVILIGGTRNKSGSKYLEQTAECDTAVFSKEGV